MDKKLAIVTGANRGIGFEVVKQLAAKGFHVILTARDEKKGKDALKVIKGSTEFHQLDVTSEKSIHALRDYVREKYGKLDVLVNNAGIFVDPFEGPEASAFGTQSYTLKRTIDTNTFGPFFMCQAFIPLMIKNRYGRVVNISSGLGQLSDMGGGHVSYRISKTALNAVTRIFAAEVSHSNVLVNSMCPGWVKTDMGGEGAEREVPEGADTAIFLATLPDGGPSGKFFRDRKVIEW